MSSLASACSLPLLGKELVELAAQRRTYWLRVVYAALLYLICGLGLADDWHRLRNPALAVGLGSELFETVVILQFLGMYLFVPALMAEAIAGEKERGSLGLVLLTELRPGSLLVQKYLARLVPVFSLLLMSLPLLAVAYALGGIQSGQLTQATVLLLLTGLQTSALALACSAYCATTVSAILASYLLSAVVFAGPPLLGVGFGGQDKFWAALLGVYHFLKGTPLATAWAPMLVPVLVFLLLGRLFLVWRAFVPPRNVLLRRFRQLDALFRRWNQRWGNHEIRFLDYIKLEENPVAWRETYKRLLGSPHHVLRLLLVIEIGSVWLGLMALLHVHRAEPINIMIGMLWVLAALVLGVQATNLIASERTGQTLEVLLTTPLDGDDILLQKLSLLDRLKWVFIIPISSLSLLSRAVEEGLFGYGFITIITLWLYPRFVCWLGLWVGLRARNQSQAILAILGMLLSWCLIPVLLGMLMSLIDDEMAFFALVHSPVGLLGCHLTGHWNEGAIAGSLSSLGLVWWAGYWLRERCLAKADDWLRRG